MKERRMPLSSSPARPRPTRAAPAATLVAVLLAAATALAGSALVASAATKPAGKAAAQTGPVDWPLTWKVGDTREFEQEYTVERRTAIDAHWSEHAAGRVRWRDTLQFDEVGAEGYVQTWTMRDATFEALTGGDELSQALSPTLKEVEALPLILELGPDRRQLRVRNFAKIQQTLRETMTPVLREATEAAMKQMAAQLNPQQRKSLRSTLDARVEQTVEQLLEKQHLQASLGEFARLHNRWQGERLRPGEQERRRDQLLTPNFNRPVEAIVSYEADLPKGHPDMVRIRWTSDVVQADLSGQWQLAEEMAGVPIRDNRRREGPPRGLTLQQRGTLVYRRSDGALQLLEVVNDALFGPNARRDHRRTRAAGTSLDWKDFAMTLTPLQPAEIPPQPGQKRRRR